MAEKDVTLKPVLKRFPPGDRWTPVDAEQPLLSSLTEGIEWVFQNTKERDYVIRAGEGKVYIYTENEIAPPEPPSPIMTEIVGTVSSIQHSIDFAIASA